MPDEHAGALPISRSGAIPARSSASQLVSSSSRCCGSMLAASRGEIPKNAGIEPSTSVRKPPQRVVIFPGASGSGS